MTRDAGRGSRWAGRSQAREAALRLLYQMEVGQLSVPEAVRTLAGVGEPDAVALDAASQEYAESLVRGTAGARPQLDDHITQAARRWRVERLTVIDRLILRLAIHELLDHPDVPPRVVIDEAIELARRYSGEEAARFVNGVLDGVFRKLKDDGLVVE